MQRFSLALGVALGLLCSAPVLAACPLPNANLPEADIVRYAENPGSLLERYPSGGPNLQSDARILAANSDYHGALTSMMRDANQQQARSIGEGLAAAAVACQRLHAETAQRIGQIATGSGNQAVALAYRSTLGEVGSAPLPGVGATMTPGLPSINGVNSHNRGFTTSLGGQQPAQGLARRGEPPAPPRSPMFDLSDPFAPVRLGQ